MLLLATLHRLYCQILCVGPTDSVREGRGALLGAIKKGRALKKVEIPTSKKGIIEPYTYVCTQCGYVHMYVCSMYAHYWSTYICI